MKNNCLLVNININIFWSKFIILKFFFEKFLINKYKIFKAFLKLYKPRFS